MNKRKIMAVPAVCFWGVIAACLLGIIVGSFYDFGINEALANKTDIGAFFATYGLYLFPIGEIIAAIVAVALVVRLFRNTYMRVRM